MNGWLRKEAVSRRRFLKGCAYAGSFHLTGAAALFADVPVGEATENQLKNTEKVFAYVGTYTGAVGSGSNGEGIYRFELNVRTGELSRRKLVARTTNPSWIAIHPSTKYLYAVNEVENFHGKNGSVSAFEVEEASGDLKALNVLSSEGAGPAYISTNTAGTLAFVANYGGGSLAVIPILADGSLSAAIDVQRDQNSIGEPQATDAPMGSFASSGHDSPHAHIVLPDPQGHFVLATDLGQDRIYSYMLDPNTGKLKAAIAKPFVTVPSGDGPRHLAFHPNGRWLYSIQEEASTLVFFRYDSDHGSLSAEQTISALPPGFAGTSFASEVLVHPSGRFLYAANRLHDSITVFSIDHGGNLTYVGESSTLGDYPGQCRIDPSGNFLFACNRRSDNITCFRIDLASGLLRFTGQYTPVGSPASITFLS